MKLDDIELDLGKNIGFNVTLLYHSSIDISVCIIPSYVDRYNSDHPPLILISIDGFRPDYLKRNLTPTLQRLMDCGTRAPYMRSVYPTMTFPNHYSIVTVSTIKAFLFSMCCHLAFGAGTKLLPIQ